MVLQLLPYPSLDAIFKLGLVSIDRYDLMCPLPNEEVPFVKLIPEFFLSSADLLTTVRATWFPLSGAAPIER
jgi:hypothetical protein